MSPMALDQNDVIREDNYFIWEFNARMKLAKENLHEHLDSLKTRSEEDLDAAAWKVRDIKAFAIIATMISPNFQSMIRTASSAAEAWNILRNFSLDGTRTTEFS